MSNLRHLKVEGCVYFITTCAYEYEKIFSNLKYARIVMDAIMHGKNQGWYDLLGFVIMPNHVRLAIVPVKRSVPAIMQGIKGFSSRKINEMRNARGKLWQDGYRDFLIDNKKVIYQKLCYIEENPVRAGIAKNPIDYPFSSAGKYETLDLSYLS
jgi:putative transposase